MNYLDPNGYVALVDDLVYALIALTAATVAICSTSFFQKVGLLFVTQSVTDYHLSVMQFGMVRLLHGIGLKIRLKMQLMQLKNLILLLNQQIIYDQIEKERKNNKRFYTITFNSDDVPILGSKLTKSKVESKLRQGKDVITYYKSDALNIANSVGSTRSKCDPKHRGSASFKHYHVKYKNIKWSIH